ncbi:MAG: hypothetical protein WD029_09700 [Microthrixaceae bacterium]
MSNNPVADPSAPSQRKRRSKFKADKADFGLAAEDPDWDASWGAYSQGQTLDQTTPFGELKALLQLPLGQVELCGDFNEAVLGVLADLIVPNSDAHSTPQSSIGRPGQASAGAHVIWEEVDAKTRLVLRLQGEPTPEPAAVQGTALSTAGGSLVQTVGSWQLCNDDLEEIATGSGINELFLSLWSALLKISGDLDPTALHLRVPCVELNGHGVLIVGGTPDCRSEMLEELFRCGARFLTTDDLVLLDGTRTVLGTPGPRWVEGPYEEPQFQAASCSAQLVSHCAVGVILVLTEGEDEPTIDSLNIEPVLDEAPESLIRPLSLAQTTSELLGCISDEQSAEFPDRGIALEMIAQLVLGASCVSVTAPSTPDLSRGVVQGLLALDPPDPRRLAVSFRLGDLQHHGTQGLEQAVLKADLIRFDQDALLLRANSNEQAEVLTADQGEELIADSLRQLASQRPKVWPTPAAFGLPGCPTAATAKRLWSQLDLSVNDQLSELPTGLAVELLSRDLLQVSAVTRDQILRKHQLAQLHANEVIDALIWVQRIASEVGVQPVACGTLVQMFDGRVPEHFCDLGRLELLIRGGDIDRFVDHLASEGFESESRRLSNKASNSQMEYRMHHPSLAQIPIDLHLTLAAGPFGMLVDPEEFHVRSVPVAIRDQWVLGLHPEHRFVAACVAACTEGTALGQREDSSPSQSADPHAYGASIAQLREVVLTAPRSERLLAAAVECSSRLGATAKVFAAVRQADELLPGLPTWLVHRARKEVNLPKQRQASLRQRLLGRKR